MTVITFTDDFSEPGRDTLNPAPGGRTYSVGGDWEVAGGLAVGYGDFLTGTGVPNVVLTATFAEPDHGEAGALIWADSMAAVIVSVRELLGATVIEVTVRATGHPNVHLGGINSTVPKSDGILVVEAIVDGSGRRLRVHWNDGLYESPDIATHPDVAVVPAATSYGLYAVAEPIGDDEYIPQAIDFFQLVYTNPEHALTTIDVIPVEPPAPVTGALGAALRNPVAYGPRVAFGNVVVPPIVAKVFRLRNPDQPVVTLDQSFARTWQEQIGEAGSGAVTLLNDDPDLALVRDGDVVRFELYGESAFSFVVNEREKATIAQGEEHDQVTTLKGPGLLSWVTSSVLVYPARQPPPLIHGPVPDRYIQGEPVEEKRIFSWASYAQLVDNDLYGGVVSAGMMEEPLPEEWPEGILVERIWVGSNQEGPVYFRMGFSTHEPQCEIYIAAPPNDPIMAWLDGVLMVESDGSLDAGDVQTIGGTLSDLGVDEHVLTIKVDHRGGVGWLAVLGLGINDDGEFTGQVMGTDLGWKAIAYPATPPPVTAGAVILAVLGEANSRRYNPRFSATFTEEFDSDGNAWPPLPEISTAVGSTLWTFFQEMTDYVEFHMAHDPRKLYAWVAGRRGDEKNVVLHGPTDPLDPQTANLAGLTHRRVT